MKTTQYIKQEKVIAVADSGGIRARWLWGLRLLQDPEAFNPGSSQLKPGRAGELVRAATAAGLRLSEREIRYRLDCARAYSTETQIRHACAAYPRLPDTRDTEARLLFDAIHNHGADGPCTCFATP